MSRVVRVILLLLFSIHSNFLRWRFSSFRSQDFIWCRCAVHILVFHFNVGAVWCWRFCFCSCHQFINCIKLDCRNWKWKLPGVFRRCGYFQQFRGKICDFRPRNHINFDGEHLTDSGWIPIGRWFFNRLEINLLNHISSPQSSVTFSENEMAWNG